MAEESEKEPETEEKNWYRLKLKEEKNETDSSKFHTLGNVTKKEAVKRLNIKFAANDHLIERFTSDKNVILIEGNGKDAIEHSLIITGKGTDRIATIGS